MRLSNYVLVLGTLLLFLFSCQILAADTTIKNDIRILIDVSGSMKQNDPDNLRTPALRLIVGLMSDDVQAGAWTFGEHVNAVVPFRKVNADWKAKAQQQSKLIHSRSLFTDMEQALNKAAIEQSYSASPDQRHIILLSDGLVDISPSDTINQQSRQRILDEIIPSLKQANVAVHTIALSDNADHELLRAMALATDGWYEQADNADTLQRVFLYLFEKAAQRDTVPLEDNHFKIDGSVSEMTLLVFRQTGAKPTELIRPDQSRVSRSNPQDRVRWYSEDNYDLITVEQPLSGEWIIDAEVDPDNRVMIMTDLKLQTTDLPNNILIGESFDFEASLTEKDKRIERQQFLTLVDATLREESEIADPTERSLNSLQEKGLYRTHVGDDFKPGRNDVVVTMKTATFERQRRQSINVVTFPFEINVERLPDQITRTHRIILIPDENLINPDKVTITAVLTAQNEGNEWSYDLMKNAQTQWQLTLADLKEDEYYTVALQVNGETIKGRQLFLQPEPILLQEKDVVMTEKQTTEYSPDGKGTEMLQNISEEITEPEPPSETRVQDEMADNSDELLPIDDEIEIELGEPVKKERKEASSSSWLTLAVGNGVIVLAIMIAIWVWRRSQATKINPGDLL